MPMHLFEHNQTAYDAAVRMLSERGKAAVIHPTGTGKSFSALSCARIIWISESAGFRRPDTSFRRSLKTSLRPPTVISQTILYFTHTRS